MATEKETVVLDFKVDQSELLKQSIASKKALIDLKEAQSDLNKEFKKGDIDAEQYAEELVQLEAQLKREQTVYTGLTKAIQTNSNSLDAQRLKLASLVKERNALDKSTVNGVKEFDKLNSKILQLNNTIKKAEQAGGDFRRNVGNYTDAIKNAAGEMNIAGVNVGALTTKLASFANPATAAVTIVGALGAAYARSTIGAKDLEFATNQLATATTIATNSFAKLISSSKDGEGLFSRLATGAIASLFGSEAAIQSGLAALNIEKLEDLQREEIDLRDQANQRLEENQELLTQVQSDQIDYNEKISLTTKIAHNLRLNEEAITGVLKQQLSVIEDQLKIDEENEDIQTAVLQKKKEIGAVERDTEKKVQNILRMEQNLTEEERKRIAINAQAENAKRKSSKFPTTTEVRSLADTNNPAADEAGAIIAIEQNKARVIENIDDKLKRDLTRANKIFANEQEKNAFKSLQLQKMIEEQKLSAVQNTVQQAASIFNQQTAAYKILATADAIINTYKGANIALGTYPPPFSYIAAAVTVAAGLANVARINGAEFAGGGYTGSGFGSPDRTGFKPAGIVHEHEYVTPKWQVYSAEARPHINALENMRLRGYADGGLVTNSLTQETNNSLITANMIKNLPSPTVGVKEINRVSRRVRVKETTSRLK